MEQTNKYDSLIQTKRLSSDESFYNLVFKKTERIVSAVLYVTSHIPSEHMSDKQRQRLEDKAWAAHDCAFESLRLFEHEAQDKLETLQHALLVLQSTLSVAVSARLVASEIVATLEDESDQVLRYIRNHYLHATGNKLSASVSSASPHTPKPKSLPTHRRARPQIPKNDMSSDAVLVYSDLSDRTTRIKTVLEAKPEATIKDLTDIITDVSAKTIQRDLNAMIEEGIVIRQGERRWSKYSVA